MATHLVVTPARVDAEARRVTVLVSACAVAFGAFVLLPSAVSDLPLPAGLDALWMLGTVFTVLLGPLAAGVAGYVSFAWLWAHGDALPARARRLYLVTLVASVVLIALLVTLGADLLSGWAD